MNTLPDRMQKIQQQLRKIFRTVQAHSKSVENRCGLSSAKLWMLSRIGSRPGIRVSQLARKLTIHPSTCSNMLDQLENLALVSRQRSTSDQRTVHLFITEDGRRLLAKCPGPKKDKLTRALEALDEKSLAKLEASLTVLIANMEGEPDKPQDAPLSF